MQPYNVLSGLIFTLITLLGLGASAHGGMETTGGGDGVACFEEVSQAQVARGELQTQGFLSAKTREQIKSVVTLETWEYLQQFSTKDRQTPSKIIYFSDFSEARSFAIAPELLKLKTAQEIRQAVSKNLQQYVPLFVLRLKMAEEKAPVSSWIPSTRVEQVDDSTPKTAVLENSSCVLIQLANRKTISTPDHFPITQITYDKELFSKFLKPLDQALLINHEYFYLIGREGNHLTSNDIRPFNTFTMSESMFPFAENKGSLGSRAVLFRQIIGYPFGDYMRFFKAEDVPNKDLLSFQNSRYGSFIRMMDKVRASAKPYSDECRQQKGYDQANSIAAKNEIMRACSQGVIDANPSLWASFTNEEAFLFFTRFYFDQFVIKDAVPTNSELLAYPQEDTPFTDALSQLYCKLTYQREVPALSPVQDKVKRYCAEKLNYSIVPGK